MTHHELEAAVRAQFTIKRPRRKPGETDTELTLRKSRYHRLHVDKDVECTPAMALWVYCGLAEYFNLDEDDTARHLGVRLPVYKQYVFYFCKYLRKALDARAAGKNPDPCKTVGRLYLKLSLTRNYLVNQTRVSKMDIEALLSEILLTLG